MRFFGSGDLLHDGSAGGFVSCRLKRYRYDRGKPAVLAGDQLFNGGLIDPRVGAEEGDCLLLTVIGFADPRPLRPRVVFRPGVGELRHHFKLDDRSAAVAYAGADAVVSGVAAADNYHVFALCRYVVPVLKSAVKQGFCCRFQKIHGKIHAVGIASLDFKVAGSAGAAAEDDRIVFRGQFLCLFAVNAASGDKADALVLHQLYPAEDDFLVELHVRDSVHQKPAGAVGAFKNRDRVSAPVQHIGAGKSGGTGADDRNALSGAYFRYSRFYKTLFKAVFDYVKLVVADCDRVAVQPAGAGGFAERGADPSGEFREG